MSRGDSNGAPAGLVSRHRHRARTWNVGLGVRGSATTPAGRRSVTSTGTSLAADRGRSGRPGVSVRDQAEPSSQPDPVNQPPDAAMRLGRNRLRRDAPPTFEQGVENEQVHRGRRNQFFSTCQRSIGTSASRHQRNVGIAISFPVPLHIPPGHPVPPSCHAPGVEPLEREAARRRGRSVQPTVDVRDSR